MNSFKTASAQYRFLLIPLEGYFTDLSEYADNIGTSRRIGRSGNRTIFSTLREGAKKKNI